MQKSQPLVILWNDERTKKQTPQTYWTALHPFWIASKTARRFFRTIHRDEIGKGSERESISLSRLSNFQSTCPKIKCDLQWLLFILFLNIRRWRHTLQKKSQALGIHLSLCIKVYPSTISAEFKITANRLTTVFLPLQMKNIRKLGNIRLPNLYWLSLLPAMSVWQDWHFVLLWDGKTCDIFIHGGVRPCNDQPWSMCLLQQPRALGEQTRTGGASSSAALLNSTRILTKSNRWKISLSNPQGHCQHGTNYIYFSFKILENTAMWF